MTLLDFQVLTMQEQVNVLYLHGVYIGKRKADKLTVLLLQLDSFYVEVFYKRYRVEITRVRCSASTNMLDPYLAQIEVEYLVS
ncbi:MAG: hypothetical protein ACJ75F_09730 [Flavisolibacter sp.]|jgi:hypothetical protein